MTISHTSRNSRAEKPRFDTAPHRHGANFSTYLYDDAGLPLRSSGRELVLVTTNPVPCTISLPSTLSVGDEITFDAVHGPYWKVVRVIHAIGSTTPTRHLWLATSAL